MCLASVQGFAFGRMGANLAHRIRLLLFRSILHQEVGWFDKDGNTSGAIVSRLANDAAAVRGATGDVLGMVIQNVVTLVCGYTVAFLASWRMTLVVTAIIPLVAVGSMIEMQSYVGALEPSVRACVQGWAHICAYTYMYLSQRAMHGTL